MTTMCTSALTAIGGGGGLALVQDAFVFAWSAAVANLARDTNSWRCS